MWRNFMGNKICTKTAKALLSSINVTATGCLEMSLALTLEVSCGTAT